MQTTFLQASEWKRFEYYGASMLTKQLIQGENYRQLQPVYQIIFVNACPQNNKRLINRYIMRDQERESCYTKDKRKAGEEANGEA